jgi:hypothetical protein
MNNKKVFELIKKDYIETLVGHIEHEIEEDELYTIEGITYEEFIETNLMVNIMISEWTCSDRFAGWLESDLEEHNIEFDQIEEVWDEYNKEIIKLIVKSN